jgi:adenylate cyclase
MEYKTMTRPTECRMVVAMVDIAGFYQAIRDKSNRQLFSMLDQFYELIGTVIENAGGTVVKFIGDGAFMVFPGDQAAPAVAALRTLQAKTQTIWSEFNATCQVKINAHIGPVICGPVGTIGDKRFDVFGATVNDLYRMPSQAFGLSDQLKKLVE